MCTFDDRNIKAHNKPPACVRATSTSTHRTNEDEHDNNNNNKNNSNSRNSSPSSSPASTMQTKKTLQHQIQRHHHHHSKNVMALCEEVDEDGDGDYYYNNSNNKHDTNGTTTSSRHHYTMTDACEGQHTTALGKTGYLFLGILGGALATLFSVYFPFWLAPQAAAKTYFLAFYKYQEDKHHFDTTVWTYGTDYFLCVAMLYHCYTLYRQQSQHNTTTQCPSHKLCYRIYGLLLGYAISVLAGAIAHQNYSTTEQRNTWHFRLLWTICVGTVTLASQSMGGIGSEMALQLQPHTVSQLPFVPDLFWSAYGIFTTIICATGWFSYQRPACDIFIAGITQFPSSFYVIILLWKQDSPYVRWPYKWMGMCSFILNAPLLPMYPLLVQYTDWTLASVNTLLHSWLFVSWSMQAISMIHVQRATVLAQQKPFKAVPRAMKNTDAAAANTNNNGVEKQKKEM